jgi:hypothetical protein
LRKHPPNPLRSEANAFACLVWFVGSLAVIVLIVLLVRALT